MLSNELENYEVLSILGGSLESACYKVRCKKSSKTQVWRAVSLDELSEKEIDDTLKELTVKTEVSIPNLVQYLPPIYHKDTKTVYIVTEYYEKSFKDIINDCKKNYCVDESFLWYTIHSIASTLKKLQSYKVSLKLSKIFVDQQNDIKLLDLIDSKVKKVNLIRDLGVVLHQICTLRNKFDYSIAVNENYTEQLRNFIDLLVSNKKDDIHTIDSILRHPTVLKAIDYKKKSLYIKETFKINSKTTLENVSNHNLENSESSKKENTQNKLYSLKNFEEKLKAKERELKQREKKVVLAERLVKEKITRAELYLKRSKENRKNPTKISHKNLDTSFSADCGDSSILPTSKRMNPDEIVKPAPFSRSLSNRRVKFKGHSPLRTIQYANTIYFNRFNGENDGKPKKVVEYRIEDQNTKCEKENCPETDSTNSLGNEKRSFSIFRSIRQKKLKKPLFRNSVTSVEDTCSGEDKNELNCKPIDWPEETKKHAFDLLRILNSADDLRHSGSDVKHTYL